MSSRAWRKNTSEIDLGLVPGGAMKQEAIPETDKHGETARPGHSLEERRRQDKNSHELRGNEGWYNLIKIVATLSVLRYVILNLIEFGFIMEFPLSKINLADAFYFSCFFILNGLRSYGSYLISTRCRSVFTLYLVISELTLTALIFFKIIYTYMSGWAYVIAIVTDLKLLSFHCLGNGATTDEFAFFILAPTLVFKKSYARKNSVDYRLVTRRSLQFVFYFIAFVFLMDQYAIPSIYKIIHSRSYFSIIENCINVSLSTILLFILFFQLMFNCFLTIASELTGFNEAIFNEWWNSSTAGEFWIRWNMPVHQFIKTHIYMPLLRKGLNKNFSRAACFVFSGLVHEAVTIMAIKKVTGWMFIAMISQIPLIPVSDAFQSRFPSYGNMFFWLSFCVIGQPIIVLLFFRSLYMDQARNIGS